MKDMHMNIRIIMVAKNIRMSTRIITAAKDILMPPTPAMSIGV